MVGEIQRLGLDAMVGNMTGTSLGMAPAFLVAQSCKFVDLDGPMFLQSDRITPVTYHDGAICCPQALWGGTAVAR
jgi:L-alanine-DL-glutamate epimerase-like enolase superfamily enzyme